MVVWGPDELMPGKRLVHCEGSLSKHAHCHTTACYCAKSSETGAFLKHCFLVRKGQWLPPWLLAVLQGQHGWVSCSQRPGSWTLPVPHALRCWLMANVITCLLNIWIIPLNGVFQANRQRECKHLRPSWQIAGLQGEDKVSLSGPGQTATAQRGAPGRNIIHFQVLLQCLWFCPEDIFVGC